jgi:hypothetical protein
LFERAQAMCPVTVRGHYGVPCGLDATHVFHTCDRKKSAASAGLRMVLS